MNLFRTFGSSISVMAILLGGAWAFQSSLLMQTGCGYELEETPQPTPGPSGAPREITTVAAPASAQNPCWLGPETLLFTLWPVEYNEGLAELWTVPLGGGAGSRLIGDGDSTNVNLPGSCHNAVTGRIVFSREETDHDEIWSATPGGEDLRRVVAMPGAFLIEPSISSDGAWIVFERRDMATNRGSLWKIRPDGTALIRLTNGAGDDRQPNWSPAGDVIVFQSFRTGDWDIWIMDAHGDGLFNLTAEPEAEDTDPSFGPQGQVVVYSSDLGGLEQSKLFILPLTGGAPARVTEAAEATYEGAPSWSSDRAWIAFESTSGNPDGGRTQLWVAPAPTSPNSVSFGASVFLIPLVLGLLGWRYRTVPEVQQESVGRNSASS